MGLLLCALFTAPVLASLQDGRTEPVSLAVTQWLRLGPIPTPLPAFHEDKDAEFSAVGLLTFNQIDIRRLHPAEGEAITGPDGARLAWTSTTAAGNELILPSNSSIPAVVYLGVYVETSRWTQAKLTITTPQVYALYMDGKRITQKKIFSRAQQGKMQPKGRKVTTDLLLETGKHLLLLKTVYNPEAQADWRLKAVLHFNKIFDTPVPPQLTLSPQKHMSASLLLEAPEISGVTISPDAASAGILTRKVRPEDDRYENTFKLYDIASGKIIQTLHGRNFSLPAWSPDGSKLAYTTRDSNYATLWVIDRTTGESTPFLKDIKNFETFTWTPDSRSVIYSVTEKGWKDIKGTKRVKNLSDRQPGWRNRSYLYKAEFPDGFRKRLTAGSLTTSLNSISPDGKKLLFSRAIIDYTKRPYAYTQLYALDLKTLKPIRLWKSSWINSVQWFPDGQKLLVLGGPSTFGEAGINLPKGIVPNEYDSQAFVFNSQSKTLDPISRDFDPSIDQAFINPNGKSIFFITGDKSYRRLYRYDMHSRNFLMIDTGVDYLSHFSLARSKSAAIYAGSSAASPPRTFLINLENYRFHMLKNPVKSLYADVSFGQIQRWTFKNRKGIDIEGRIYLPPEFDAKKKYPCIVYCYGGTLPVTRDFGGRYPKNLWTANGYVVYVLQPSGATGFGQAFSAKHVNDWGIVVADEIIMGVTQFLKSHPFVDRARVGCIGASYGGFMTMLLQTRTSMFAAAVAHAGISSISSYWGQGYWGYQYSAIAAANSFPWNRKDIYISQSPLFHADKISTPLLLLHGTADTNVPTGESTQLFTALKLLGREVEYIQIEGQNHHIMQFSKRKIWTKSILAWFDKWLKNQPEWWASLYPDRIK